MSYLIYKSINGSSMLPLWIKLWLGISGIICTIDVLFTMFRPATLRGNKLGDIFYLWNIYADVDIRYAMANDLVTHTTGRLMLLEIFLNFLALYMDTRRSKHTIVTTFFTSVLVFWKTVIYMALYIGVPNGNESYFTPGTPNWKIFLCFWMMNGVWIVIPLMAIVKLWQELAAATLNRIEQPQAL